MKIVRDGKEIKLTPQEMRLAYDEYQHTLDEHDIENFFRQMERDRIEEKYGVTRGFLTGEVISDMAFYMRRNIDEYDMSWEYAMDDAIRSVICIRKAGNE